MKKLIVAVLAAVLIGSVFRTYQVQYLLHANQVVILEPYMALDVEIPEMGISIHKPFDHKYGHGSGVLIGHRGYILTAGHMVKNSSLFFVKFKDGFKCKAVFVALDHKSDLALLKIYAEKDVRFNGVNYLGLTPMVGDSVYHIGNPIDMKYILTTGIVSSVTDYTISTTVINPGSSGGALFNREGQLIGICSALKTMSPFPAWSGHSLFVTVNDIKRFLGMWREVING